MVRTCPLCAIVIALDRPCSRCGLWWARARPSSAWADGRDAPARPIVCRARDLCARVTAAVGLGGLGASAVAATLTDAAAAPLGWTIAGVVVCSIIGGALCVAAIRILGDDLLRAIFAERIERGADLVRVRVRSRWGRRSDARVPRAMIRGVVLVPWQLDTQEVWVVVDGDLMFRVADARMRDAAQRHAHAVSAAIHGREPLPCARVVRRA